MMGGTLVSVVVPVYGIKPEYLRKSVESILNQTYAELEVILVDDGSPDSCGQICDEYAVADSRVDVIHQENAGVSVARNAGMEVATGELVAFVDPDDWLDEDCIEQLVAAFPESAQIVSCCCRVVGADFVADDHFFDGDRVCSGADKDDLFYQLMRSTYGQPQKAYTAIGVPWGKLYRTQFLREQGLAFDPALRRMQDNIFNMYAFAAADEVMYVDRPLYNYRHEHIADFSKRLGASYIDIYTSVSKARVEALEATGLAARAEMRQACDEEVAGYLVNMLNNVVFAAGGATFAERRAQAEALVSELPFDGAVQRAVGSGPKRRLWLSLARHRRWRTYGALAAVRNLKQRVAA